MNLSGIRLASWNARGVKNKKLEMQRSLLEEQKIDILGIQEAKLNKKDVFRLAGYNIFRDKNRDQENIIVIYNEKVKLTEIRNIQNDNYALKEIKIHNIRNQPDIHVTFVYFWDSFKINGKEELEQIFKLSNHSLIMGDMNAHDPLWGAEKRNNRGRSISEFINDNEIVLLNNNEPTRIPQKENESPTLLDLALITYDLNTHIHCRVNRDTLGSDHLPVIIESTILLENTATTNTLKFKYEKADWIHFREETCKINWKECRHENINTYTENIITNLQEVAIKSIPNNMKSLQRGKNQIIKKNNKKLKLTKYWWNTTCQAAKNDRIKKLREYQKEKSNENLIRYRIARNKADAIIKKTKKDAWKSFCSNQNTIQNPKKVWDHIKKMDGKNKNENIATLEKDNIKFITDKEKANILAEQFYNVSSNDRLDKNFKKIKYDTERTNRLFSKEPLDNKEYNRNITLSELDQALNQKDESSPGDDLIIYKFIKNGNQELKNEILYLFNLIFETGNIPDIFKIATVIPVLKPGKDARNPCSYRPISLTSQLGKTLETIINKRLINYVINNNLISNTQSGFLRKRGCIDQIARLDMFIREWRSKGWKTQAAFLDLEKAYDTLWRGGLLLQLKKKGISGSMFNYILSFLSDRSFRVRINYDHSNIRIQENGVPQGAVLSPILFNILIDLYAEKLNNHNNSKIKDNIKINLGQFADDIALWLRSRGKTFNKKLINTLEYSFDELRKIGFKVNKKKTQLITFFRKSKDEKETTIENETIEIQNKIKYLGVTMDSKLTYKWHVEECINKANKSINILKSLCGRSWGAPVTTLRTIYLGLVRSKLTYGQEIYGSTGKGVLSELDKVQHRALRTIMSCTKSTSGVALEVILKIPPLEIIRMNARNSYWTKTQIETDHPLKEIYDKYNDPLNKMKQNCQPSCIKNKTDRQSGRIEEIKMLNKPHIIYPWLIPSLSVDLGLSKVMRKKETNPVVQKQTTLEYLENHYKNHTKIYTDGSKTNNLTAAGIYWEDIDQFTKIRLDNDLSITSAESFAILACLRLLETKNIPHNNKILILSDSKSTLQNCIKEIERTERPDIMLRIALQSYNFHKQGIEITFLWIPAHCGLEGNENADEAAKLGIENHLINTSIGLSHKEYQGLFKREISFKTWQRYWQNSNCKTSTYFPNVNIGNKLSHILRRNRKLARIILNRPYFWPYPNFNKLCLKCDVINDVHHVIMECKKNKEERKKLYEKLGFSPEYLGQLLGIEILEKHVSPIIHFINSIQEEI